jgi:hypothetical protein
VRASSGRRWWQGNRRNDTLAPFTFSAAAADASASAFTPVMFSETFLVLSLLRMIVAF